MRFLLSSVDIEQTAIRKIVHPIKTLTEAAEKLAKNDYRISICHSSTKEIIQLNATFQHMTE